jgi:hypothetical protein
VNRKEDPSNLVTVDGKHHFTKEFLKSRSVSQSNSFASKKSKRASTKRKSVRDASPETLSVNPPIVQRIIENEGQDENGGGYEDGSHQLNLASSPGGLGEMNAQGNQYLIEEDVEEQVEPSHSIMVNRKSRLEHYQS